jgi:GGDEF domain-containing protein
VFVLLVLFERPGLGLGRFFFVAIVLLALATNAWVGALGGVTATALLVLAIVASPRLAQSEIVAPSTLIRFTSFVAVGALIGYFAKQHRELVARLQALAERDALTGLPRGRAFESEITKRLDAVRPFSILLGEIEPLMGPEDRPEQDTLIRVAALIRSNLDPRDTLVRVGNDEFAVLTSRQSGAEARKLVATLESVLDQQGLEVTFGWAVSPQEGTNALSLCQAADDRRHARKLIRGGRTIPVGSRVSIA